jgi:hypothetical protein
MFRHGLGACAASLLLLAAMDARAADDSAPPAPPPKSALDVTMNVVPLNADIEKTVVQTITVPVNAHPGVLSKQSPKHPGTPTAVPQSAQSTVKATEKVQVSVSRDTAEARRQAEEAAREARKDRNNSSASDNGTPPPP